MLASRLETRADIRNTLDARARRYEGGFIRPPEVRRAIARQSLGLFAVLVVFAGVVLIVTLGLSWFGVDVGAWFR